MRLTAYDVLQVGARVRSAIHYIEDLRKVRDRAADVDLDLANALELLRDAVGPIDRVHGKLAALEEERARGDGE